MRVSATFSSQIVPLIPGTTRLESVSSDRFKVETGKVRKGGMCFEVGMLGLKSHRSYYLPLPPPPPVAWRAFSFVTAYEGGRACQMTYLLCSLPFSTTPL